LNPLKENSKFIPHNKPTLSVEEEKITKKIIRSGWLAQGKEVKNFEKDFCDFLELPEEHAVAVSSGTAALFLALWAMNAKGKNVAFPVYACSSLRHAVAMVGGTEVLLDSSSNSPNVDTEKLKKAEFDLAIVPHMFGLPFDLSPFSNLRIIEDCAQAIGAKISGNHVGLTGEIGIFSFYATKLMTSGGQGGMIVSKDKFLIDAIRDYREFDCRNDQKKRFNFQITDLQAAIGRIQLKKLPEFLKRRKEIFQIYCKKLPMLEFEKSKYLGISPVYYRAILRTNYPRKVIEALENENIKTIVPIEDWELMGKASLFPNANQWTKNTVSLPIYPSLKDFQIDFIIEQITKLNHSHKLIKILK
tara:strand:- start:12 stop:1088 length:1077 start_codon:yes stop_codon:yes gene_type:complete